ncbi:heavy metal translocating P-type ATPase [Alkalithermobacter paradoxus]|uniref:heavy metal translocating P-type ATPase n=1 Tax=Alkalithermobacter paradoxus TaxID=29349 RepID=UPI002F917B1B
MSILIKEFILEGLDCAGCSSKIELEVNKINGVITASLNFVTKVLKVQVNHEDNVDYITHEIKTIVKNIEPHVLVIENKPTHQPPKNNNENKLNMIKLSIGTALFILAILFRFSTNINFMLYFISYILIGGDILVKAARNVYKKQFLDENFLMSIATIGAFTIKEFPEGVAVMLFYKVGEFFQNLAVNKSRKSIKDLMDIRPDYANLKFGDEIKKVYPDQVNIGDIVIVKPGEKIPLDGIVIHGNSFVDTSALTGESTPKSISIDDEVLSGYINKSGLISVKVSKEFGESTVSKILNLVENASSRKAPTEQFITKFSRYYTPVVVILALSLALLPPLFISNESFSTWIYRALVFLVVSCPCALVVSIPLGFFGGIGGASSNGILIKGGNYLEALNEIEIAVFDKTGTLTEGVFDVSFVKLKDNLNKDDILDYIALAESYSNHPIATSILKYYGKDIDKSLVDNFEEIPGYGVKASIKGSEVVVGNENLMKLNNISYDSVNSIGTIVHVSIDRKYCGFIIISDKIKHDSKKAIEELKKLGVKKTVMLTGDNKYVAQSIGKDLGLDLVYSSLLPHEKVEKLENLYNDYPKGKILFVGDGINDAPVLARADVGVSMGSLGSDAAIEASDVVIMTDNPLKVATAIKIAKFTRKIVWQNIIFSLSVKAMVLILGAGGIATMWEAVFADVGVALIAVLNAMRVLKANKVCN